jgi:arylsulfatase A-like enzyme
MKTAAARLTLVCAALGVGLAGAASIAAQDLPGPAGDRPNVILLMVDDLDVASLDAAAAAGYVPNLVEHVWAGGTEFTESFVTISLCCPSRATALTGQYAHNHGVVRNTGPSGGFARFADGSTLATWLRGAGYHTGHVGKYLNGYTDPSYVPPGWDDWQGLVDPTTYCMYGYTVSDNGSPVAYGSAPSDYQTDVLAGRAEDFIREWHERGDARPFFLSLAPLAPHLESVCEPLRVRPAPRHEGSVALPLPRPPSFNERAMGDKPAWMRRLSPLPPATLQSMYADRIASLRAVDDMVGRLARRLRASGAAGRTAVFFTSDNGYLLGQHRWPSKVLMYEESIRVPLIIRLPWAEQRPSAGQIALNNDLAPTIAALAGAEPGLVVDGRSLLPLLQGEATPWRRRFLVEYPPAPRDPAQPQAQPEDALAKPRDTDLRPFFAVRTGAADAGPRLVYGETWDAAGAAVTDVEHYDLALDPFQLRSLHDDLSPARVLQRRVLSGQLQVLKVCGAGSCHGAEE